MRAKLIVFLMPIVLISCMSEKRHNRLVSGQEVKEFNKEYLESRRNFEDRFIDHFPSSIEDLPATVIADTSSTGDHRRFMLIQYPKTIIIDSLITLFSDSSIAIYKANGDCNLIVNRFTTKENWHLHNKNKYVDKSMISRDCYLDKYPIPNFWDSDINKNDTDCKLPKDFNIYVLESKSGKFKEDKYLTSGRYMPDDWKNGYSKGVAISKKRNTIIYWFIIW